MFFQYLQFDKTAEQLVVSDRVHDVHSNEHPFTPPRLEVEELPFFGEKTTYNSRIFETFLAREVYWAGCVKQQQVTSFGISVTTLIFSPSTRESRSIDLHAVYDCLLNIIQIRNLVLHVAQNDKLCHLKMFTKHLLQGKSFKQFTG